MSKRAVLYARVSTDEQADKGYSLPSQLDSCRKYAEQHGFTVIEELREDFSGGTPFAERPEGKRLMEMLRRRAADAIISHQVDRLSRDNVDLLVSIRQWLRAGVEVHTCDIGKIEDENNILLVIKGWQGSDERKKIVERTMRGKRTKAQSGKVVVCGHAPYGFAYLRDEKGRVISFAIVEEEARIVRIVYRWYVHGDENGKLLSAHKIAWRLSEMRVPTPSEARGGYFRKRGAGMWNIRGVLSIIENEVYAGVWRFGWRMGKAKKKRPLEEATVVDVPAIIDHDIWERAQAQRKYNKDMAIRNGKHEYLLRGLIFCGCGRKMVGTLPNGHRHYACNLMFNHHARIEQTCPEKYVRADAIEADVWQEIEKLFSDLDRLSSQLRKAQQDELHQQDPIREELAALDANIKRTEQEAEELTRTLSILTKSDPDGVVAKKMMAQVAQTNELYRGQIKRREDLIAELGSQRLTDEAIQEIMQYARDVQEGIQNPDYGTKRRILESLRVKVTIKNKCYTITCILGKTDGTVRTIPRKNARSIVQASC